MTVMDVVAQIKAEPFGPTAGIYNIKTHLLQLQSVSGTDLLWSANTQEPRPVTPPEYRPKYDTDTDASTSKAMTPVTSKYTPPPTTAKYTPPPQKIRISNTAPRPEPKLHISRTEHVTTEQTKGVLGVGPKVLTPDRTKKSQLQSPRIVNRPLTSMYIMKKPVYKVYDNGDCGLDPRLPSIDEHSTTEVNEKVTRNKNMRIPFIRKVSLEEERPIRLNSCPNRGGDKRTEFYRKGGDGLPR